MWMSFNANVSMLIENSLKIVRVGPANDNNSPMVEETG